MDEGKKRSRQRRRLPKKRETREWCRLDGKINSSKILLSSMEISQPTLTLDWGSK